MRRADENTGNRLLIICSERDRPFADAICAHLHKEFADLHADVSYSLRSGEDRLEQGDYNWLVIWQSVPERATQDIYLQRGLVNGLRFAQRWLADHTDGRAIVITQRWWDELHGEFVDRLSAIPNYYLTPDSLHFLTEVIHAGQVGYTLIPPTVVRFQLRKRKEDGRCILELDGDPDGPLQSLVGDRLRRQLIDKPSQTLGKFDDVVSAFQEACDKANPEERRQAVVGVANMLRPESTRRRGDLLTSFLGAVKDSLKLWSVAPHPMDPNAPFPVQLHLLCEPEMLAVPVDLILDNDIHMGHISAQVPVIWRIKSREWTYSDDEERAWNRTSYDNFVGIYSCSRSSQLGDYRLPPVGDAHEKINRILKRVGKGNEQPVGVMDPNELREILIQSADNDNRRTAHVISHGIHARPADLSSIFVGPDDRGNAIPVTVNQLRPERNRERGTNFVYFNCPGLGNQDPEAAVRIGYAGGFAEGAIRAGVCREIITNRWTVDQEWAHELELAFYETKPCTAQSRAVALLRARLKVLQKMRRKPTTDPADQFEPTWLAPIHIWADPM